MRLAELQAAGRQPQLPLRVTLADGEIGRAHV